MNKSKILEYIFVPLILIIVIGIIVHEILYNVFHDSTWYVLRSLVLTTLGCLFAYCCFRIIRQRRKFATRTLPEIIDDILSSSMWKQIGYLFLLSLIAFLFSWIFVDALSPDYESCSSEITKGHNTFWLTICYFFDPGNLNLTPHDNPGWQGVVSLVVAVLGMTLLTGLFISTFTNILESRKTLVKSGLVTYKNIRCHSVVIGFCELTESVIRGILESKENTKVVLLTNHDIDDVRKSLFSLLNCNEFDGRIVLYSGDYRMDDNLLRLNLPETRNIYVLGDDEMWSRDYENLSTAQKISKICESSDKDLNINEPVPLYVRMDRTPSFTTLQRLNIDKDFFSDKVYFRPFNYYEHWTRMLWTKRQVSIYDVSGEKRTLSYPSLFFDKSKKGQQRYVHLVVSGFSEMGMSITLQAIRLAHYGNYMSDKSMLTKITVVDPNIDELKASFLSQFRNLDQIYDIDISFRNCRLEDMDNDIKQWSTDKEQMLTLAICLGDADAALSQALSLPLETYYQFGRNSEELPRILVRQKSLSGIWKMLYKRNHEEIVALQDDVKAFRKGEYNKYRHIYPFGMLVSGFYPDDMDDLKACLIHIDYEDTWVYSDKSITKKITISNLYSLVKAGNINDVSNMIETALKRWHPIQENIKWSNRYQTDIHNQQKAILNESGITEPEQIDEHNANVFYQCSNIEHRRWVAERVLSGWQQSPFLNKGKPMRQDSLLLHYDITPDIGEDKDKDEFVVKNILMLDAIYDFYKAYKQ